MTQYVTSPATFGLGYIPPSFSEVSKSLLADPLSDELPLNTWIELMSPHISEKEAGGFRTFSLVEPSELGVLANSGFAELARLHCAVANLMKVAPASSATPAAIGQGSPQGRYVSYWWGFSIFMNGPLTNEILGWIAVGLGAAGIAAGIAAACGPAGVIPAAIIGGTAGVLGVYGGAMQWALGQDAGVGCVVNAPWLNPLLPWIAPW